MIPRQNAESIDFPAEVLRDRINLVPWLTMVISHPVFFKNLKGKNPRQFKGNLAEITVDALSLAGAESPYSDKVRNLLAACREEDPLSTLYYIGSLMSVLESYSHKPAGVRTASNGSLVINSATLPETEHTPPSEQQLSAWLRAINTFAHARTDCRPDFFTFTHQLVRSVDVCVMSLTDRTHAVSESEGCEYEQLPGAKKRIDAFYEALCSLEMEEALEVEKWVPYHHAGIAETLGNVRRGRDGKKLARSFFTGMLLQRLNANYQWDFLYDCLERLQQKRLSA